MEIFRYADWDGIVGLGFTMDSDDPQHQGSSVIDRLIKQKECKEKVFSFEIYENSGKMQFCSIP